MTKSEPEYRYTDLLTIVKRRKLTLYGHVTRSEGLVKLILQVNVKDGYVVVDLVRCGSTTSKNGQTKVWEKPNGWLPTGRKGKYLL